MPDNEHDMNYWMIKAIGNFDQLIAGLRANDPTYIEQAKITLHQMVDLSDAVQLEVLLSGPRIMAEKLAEWKESN